MARFKKGIKGQLVLPCTDEVAKNINENIEVFKAVIARDFNSCLFDIYEGMYNEDEVIGIDFDIKGNLVKEVKADYTRFKKEIYNHFGYKPTEIFVGQYDKLF